MVEIVELLVPIAFFASVLLGLYFFLRYRNTERLALIEKAADPKMFKSSIPKFPWQKVGLLLTGLGIGVLVGSFLQGSVGMLEDTGIVFSMLIFGGLAMILAAKLDDKKEETDLQ